MVRWERTRKEEDVVWKVYEQWAKDEREMVRKEEDVSASLVVTFTNNSMKCVAGGFCYSEDLDSWLRGTIGRLRLVASEASGGLVLVPQ